MEIHSLINLLERNKDKITGEVFIQRIEDNYFNSHGWKSIEVKCEGEDFPSEYIHTHGFFIKDGNLYIDAHY